jgi:hypothetical protein
MKRRRQCSALQSHHSTSAVLIPLFSAACLAGPHHLGQTPGHPTMAASLPLMAVGGVCGWPHQDGSQRHRLLSMTARLSYHHLRSCIGKAACHELPACDTDVECMTQKGGGASRVDAAQNVWLFIVIVLQAEHPRPSYLARCPGVLPTCTRPTSQPAPAPSTTSLDGCDPTLSHSCSRDSAWLAHLAGRARHWAAPSQQQHRYSCVSHGNQACGPHSNSHQSPYLTNT